MEGFRAGREGCLEEMPLGYSLQRDGTGADDGLRRPGARWHVQRPPSMPRRAGILTRQLHPRVDVEQCLETFLVVPPGLCAIDSRWAEARDAAWYPTVHRVASTEMIWPQTSVVPGWGRTVEPGTPLCAVFWGMLLFLSCCFLS